jgi:hypothetical protein
MASGTGWRSRFSLPFALAFLANEGDFCPRAGARRRVRASRSAGAGALRLVLHAAPFVALASGWLCTTRPPPRSDQVRGLLLGPHVVRNYAIYLSRIAFPRTHPHARRCTALDLGGGMVDSVFLPLGRTLRGSPRASRWRCAFVPVEIWTASRYTYAAVAFSP